jgi:hypothetical protein
MVRADGKEAIMQQGDRKRKYAHERSQATKLTLIEVGTVVWIKIDWVGKGKLDHKSVPGIICKIMEHSNYSIFCKGGVLKDCLMKQRF